MMGLIALRHSEFISESSYSANMIILNLAYAVILNLTHSVILNLFQDNSVLVQVMLKQVQHDEVLEIEA